MKIDMHVHAQERSACSVASQTELVQAAVNAGLDAIVFTDHGQLAPVEDLQRLNDIHAPFRVFGGIELKLEGDELLVLGIHDARLESDAWTYPDLYAFVTERDGFLVVAHPFRYQPGIGLDLERMPPDAIEAYSANTPAEEAQHIIDLASRTGMRTLSNSDAHSTERIGKYYNILARTPADERELLDILRKGQIRKFVLGTEVDRA